MRVGAALAVIVSHSFILTGNEPNQIPRILGFFAVNCFFIISGFLVCKSLLSRPGLPAFLWARVLRIYPALAIAVLLCVFIIGPLHTRLDLSAYFASAQTWRFLLNNTTLLTGGVEYYLPGVFTSPIGETKVNAPLWTLFYEIYMYLGLGLLALLLRPTASLHRFEVFRYGLLLITIACFVGFILDIGYRLFREPVYAHLVRFGYFFAMGACLYLFRGRIKLSPQLLFLFLILITASTLHRISFNATTYLFLGYILLYLAYIPRGWWLNYNRLGDYSYGLYIFAYPIQQSIVQWFPNSSTLMVFLTSLTITLGLAVLSWHLLEQHALKCKDLIGSNLPPDR